MKYLALDIETNGLDMYNGLIWMVALHDGKKVNVYEDCYGKCKPYFAKLKAQLEDPKICKVIHNAAFDAAFIELKTGIRITNIWDTMLCEVVIQGLQIPKDSKDQVLAARHSSSLLHTLPRYGFKPPDKSITQNFIARPIGKKFSKEELAYVKYDVQHLIQLQKAQEYLLIRDGQLEVALLENKCVERVAAMKAVGIGWSPTIWKSIADDTVKEFNTRMSKLPKTVNNWNSPKQVKDYFKSQGIMINSFDDLDTAYQQSKNVTLKNFIEARSLSKSVTAYGMNWFTDGYCDSDGRIRSSIQQIINTGRMSMLRPNLQQLPAKGKHRSAFIPRKGCKFVIGDFSGQEMGVMAACADESIWIDAMLRGDDIHALTASILYKDEWARGYEKGCTFPKKCACPKHKVLREPTKILNFMLAYGGGPTKFAEGTGCTFEEAKLIIRRYRKIVPHVTSWLNYNAKQALKTGVSYSGDPYKRRRVLRGVEDWQIENQGKNNPVQAAGANMLKLAMVSLPKEYAIVLVIHDEVILEVKNAQAVKASKVLKQVMEDSADYITGIKGLIKVTPKISINLTKD